MRRVARADGSVGRIFDGHLNAVERLAVQAPAELRDRELAAFAAGELRAGVWGGDPVPGEGDPAAVVADRRGAACCAASRPSARAPAACTARWCSPGRRAADRRCRCGST